MVRVGFFSAEMTGPAGGGTSFFTLCAALWPALRGAWAWAGFCTGRQANPAAAVPGAGRIWCAAGAEILPKTKVFSWFIASLSWPEGGFGACRDRPAGCLRGGRRQVEMIPVPRPLRGVEIAPAGAAETEPAPHPLAAPNRGAGGAGERSLIVPIGAKAGLPCVSR